VKWDKPTGSTQQTMDGRYEVMAANSLQWVAYSLSPPPKDLGVKPTDAEARDLCEAHERSLIEQRRSA